MDVINVIVPLGTRLLFMELFALPVLLLIRSAQGLLWFLLISLRKKVEAQQIII